MLDAQTFRLELNADTLKTRLHRAKAQLRQRIVQQLGTTSPQTYAFHLARWDRVVGNVRRSLGIEGEKKG